MKKDRRVLKLHRHRGSVRHALQQRHGVPYLTERTVCARCGELLSEQPLRRAAA